MIKTSWLKSYAPAELPMKFELVFQSWDTANKPTQLSDYSVCTTWGVKDKHLYLLHVYRKRVGYPELKRAVRDQADPFSPRTILIEDKASGTQLIQELVSEGMHAIQKYEPTMDKIMRLHSASSTIENGFVHVPDQAPYLGEYLHELSSFPKGKYDDQADSTSQALDWFKSHLQRGTLGYIEYLKQEAGIEAGRGVPTPQPKPCINCDGFMTQHIVDFLRCPQCGAQWWPNPRPIAGFTRSDVLRAL